MKCLRAILIIAAVSAFSILWLLPKTDGDPLIALFVGWAVLFGPVVCLKGMVDPDARRRRL